MRRRARRSGHVEIWATFLLVSLVVLVALVALGTIVWPEGEIPLWYKILTFAAMPISWVYILLITVWGIGLPSIVLAMLESQSSKIGLAFWQWESERTFGIPRGILKRALVLGSTLGATLLGAMAYYGSWDSMLAATSFEVFIMTASAMSYLCLLIAVLAHFSDRDPEWEF